MNSRLEALLGGQTRATLRQRLRRHFEREGEQASQRIIQLGKLEPDERETLAALIGLPAGSARSIRLDIAALDTRLREAGISASLREALERLDGPIINQRALRKQMERDWSNLLTHPQREPRLQRWLQTAEAGAQLKRLAKTNLVQAEHLLQQAGIVLRQLPAASIPRSQLAAQHLGNAHALDEGQPVASLVLAVWRSGNTDTEFESQSVKERTRDSWASAGVLVNELARPALVLNLPVCGQVLDEAGEPTYLSLRKLLRNPPVWQVQRRDVYVCENPNLLAIIADTLGKQSAPLVCTDGMPAAAQRTLLDGLAACGAHLHYHGDFDWAGVQIANYVLARWQAKPWQMNASDYQEAVKKAPVRARDLQPTNIRADWDGELVPLMYQYGLAIAEEALADRLMDDLRCR